ncbi:hypothetical protein EV714DRAFT_206353, partial [Schizophyllum commune]
IKTSSTTPLVSQPGAQAQHMTMKEARGGRDKWTLPDLPAEVREIFSNIFVPLSRSLQAPLDPWAGISVHHIQLVAQRCVKGLFVHPKGAVVGLTTYRCNDSRTNMARRAIEVVAETFEAEPFSGDIDMIKTYVEHATTHVEIAGPTKMKTAPMFWRHWGKGGENRHGFMQTDLIIATFSQHLVETVHAICPNPPMELCNDAPVGALLLASQAVHRALLCYATGEFVHPTKNFSATHWNDYYDLINGRSKLVKRATKYVPTLRKWPASTWADIRARAEAYLAIGQDDNASRASEADAQDDDSADEDILMESEGELEHDSDVVMGNDVGAGSEDYVDDHGAGESD